ncbi:hypothetical protein ACQ4WX_35910 [Streptomyces lasalocidi]
MPRAGCRRRVLRAARLLALPAGGYVALLIGTVLGGPGVSAPFVPQPDSAHPATPPVTVPDSASGTASSARSEGSTTRKAASGPVTPVARSGATPGTRPDRLPGLRHHRDTVPHPCRAPLLEGARPRCVPQAREVVQGPDVSGAAGKLGRRGVVHLLLFQVLLPLLALVVDLFALYGLLFLDPVRTAALWLAFLLLQLLLCLYAFRLDGERTGPLWSLPLQQFVYRQLMCLVVIQSVVTAVSGTRLRWQRAERYGSLRAPAGARPES